MRKNILAFACVIALLILNGCDDNASSSDKLRFSYKSLNSENMEIVTLSDASEMKPNFTKSIFLQSSKRPMLVFFIYKDCNDCLDILPHIVDIYSRHRDDIYILGLGSPKDKAFLKELVAQSGIDFPIFVSDDRRDLADFWGISNYESNILFFNKNGGKIFHYKGRVPEEMVLFEIKTELENIQD